MRPVRNCPVPMPFIALGVLALLIAGRAAAQVDPPIDPTDAQTPWRYIGIAADPLPPNCTFATPFCPAAPLWTGTDLFAPGPIPPGLEGFCAYESDTGLVADLDALVSLGCLVALDADVMAVTPLATPQPFEGLVWEALRDDFLARAGRLPPAAAPREPLVRLTIVDTQPTAQLVTPGNSGHGFALGQLADDLVCTSDERCGVDIRTRLALPWTDFCRDCIDTQKGGYFGTIAGLAAAVREEVAAWEQANDAQERRLVLNLSVGWDPRYGAFRFGGGTPTPVLAMLRALQDATCRGAVVVAAAGNRLAGPENTRGPLLPGGWEDLPAPGFSYCRLNLAPGEVDENDFPTEPVYRPLVYAAGSVDRDDVPVLTRVRGEPPRVAYGVQAVADALVNGTVGPTDTLTGSSVGALVVSAAAAATWHYNTAAPSWKIVGEVEAAGRDLQRPAQFCLPPGPSPCDGVNVQRVSVCAPVAAVCAGNPQGTCPPPGSFDCPSIPPGPPALPFDDIEALFGDPAIPSVDVATLTQLVVDPADCGEDWLLRAHPEDVIGTACPQRQFYAMQATPWTNPQPSSQPCPTCTGRFESPGRLYIEIADEFAGDLTDVTVMCGNNLGFRLPDDMLTLSADHRYLVTGIPAPCAAALQVAWRVVGTGPDPTVSAFTRVVTYTN